MTHDEDEKALWDHITRDVEPLKDRNLPTTDDKGTPKTPRKKTQAPRRDTPALSLQTECQRHQGSFSKDLDKRTDERLRRGQMRIDLTIDLHGMNREQAQRALAHRLNEAFMSRKRTALIITGKGRGKASSAEWIAPKPGVLKQNLPSWLNEAPLRDIVLKAYPAKPADGGDGAFYVYLRRKRETRE